MKRMLLMAFLAATATAVVSDGPASAKTQAPSAASLVKVSTPCLDRLAGSLSGMMMLATHRIGPSSVTAGPKRKRDIQPGACCSDVNGVCISICAKPKGSEPCTGDGDCTFVP